MDPRFSGSAPPLASSAALSGAHSPEASDRSLARPSRPPRLWTLAATPVLGLVLGMVLFTVTLEIAGVHVTRGTEFLKQLAIQQPVWNLIQILAGGIGIVVAVVIAAVQSPTPFRDRLGLGPGTLPIRDYPWVIIGGFCLDLLVLAIVYLLQASGVSMSIPDDVLKLNRSIARSGWPLRLATIVCMGAIPGIAEELLFRGYIQRRLLERWRPVVAILIVVAMFAAMHGWKFPFVLGASVWLGFVAWRTGSIWPGVLYHAVSNSLFTVVQLQFAFVEDPVPGSPEMRDGVVYVLLAILPLALLAWMAWRRVERTPIGTLPRIAPAAE